jgi:transposase-like protein
MYQRYPPKNSGRIFRDKTGTIFAHPKLSLKEWCFTIHDFYDSTRSSTDRGGDRLSYRTVRQRVKHFPRALDMPSITLSGPVEIDEVYASAGLKGRDRDQELRSRGLSTRGRGSYDGDKPPAFTLIDRGSDERYVVPAKSADESTIRPMFTDHNEESLTVYTDGFRAYDPLEDDDAFPRERIVHGDGEYADSEVHANTDESHASLTRRWLSFHRGISKNKPTPSLGAFQLPP